MKEVLLEKEARRHLCGNSGEYDDILSASQQVHRNNVVSLRPVQRTTAGDFHKASYETAGMAVMRAAVLDYTLQSYVKRTDNTRTEPMQLHSSMCGNLKLSFCFQFMTTIVTNTQLPTIYRFKEKGF